MNYYAYHEQKQVESTADMNVEYDGPDGETVSEEEAQRLINLGYSSFSTKLKRTFGGAQAGAGRPEGVTQKAISFKIDIDSLTDLKEMKVNINRFINEAVHEKLDRLHVRLLDAEQAD